MEPRVDGASLKNFTIGRALGLGFRAWFANFIPVTLIAAVLYAPIIAWATTLPGADALETRSAKSVVDTYVAFIQHGTLALIGISTLLAPLLVYRVVQWMNGRSAPIGESLKYGVRGILPSALLAGVTYMFSMIPAGALINAILVSVFFVAASSAVAEKLGPFAALSRGARLTEGRRGGIFLLNLLMGIVVVAVMFAVVSPLTSSNRLSPTEAIGQLKRTAFILIGVVCVFQIISAMVQAVSYSLLRTDKDGISNEELANVFG